MTILHFVGNKRLPRDPDREAVGGVARVALELARAQHARGHVTCVATTSGEPWQSEWGGIRVASLGVSTPDRASPAQLPGLRMHIALVRLARALRCDVVHGHEYADLRFVPCGIRVAHVHNSLGLDGQRPGAQKRAAAYWRTAHATDAQVGVSAYIAEELRAGLALARTRGACAGNIHTVPNGVAPSDADSPERPVSRAAVRARWAVAPGDTVFLFAGALRRDKGLTYLADAFSALSRDLSSVHLAIAGASRLWGDSAEGAAYEQALRDRLAPDVAAGRVGFLGLLGPRELRDAYAACDVFVLPSIVNESFGLALLEAFEAGRPAIATAVGGVPEFVDDTTGVLVPPRDPAALRGAMQALAMDPSRRALLGAAAAARARGYSWSRSAGQLEQVYESCAPAVRRDGRDLLAALGQSAASAAAGRLARAGFRWRRVLSIR